MTIRWLAFLSCALISIPPLAAPRAQAQSPAGDSTALMPSAPSSSGLAVETIYLNGNTPGEGYRFTVMDRFTTAALTAPAAESVQMRAVFTTTRWTAQDAQFVGEAQPMDSGNDPAAAASDKEDCRWSFGVANDWSCKIKPLTRYDFPGRHVLHSLWPLHGKTGGQ